MSYYLLVFIMDAVVMSVVKNFFVEFQLHFTDISVLVADVDLSSCLKVCLLF